MLVHKFMNQSSYRPPLHRWHHSGSDPLTSRPERSWERHHHPCHFPQGSLRHLYKEHDSDKSTVKILIQEMYGQGWCVSSPLKMLTFFLRISSSSRSSRNSLYCLWETIIIIIIIIKQATKADSGRIMIYFYSDTNMVFQLYLKLFVIPHITILDNFNTSGKSHSHYCNVSKFNSNVSIQIKFSSLQYFHVL